MVHGAGLVIVLLLTAATAAGAHAFLDRADPRVGSHVHAPPARVTLWFTERLEPTYCRVRVVNEAGAPADRGDGGVDSANDRVLRVSLPPLAVGTYRVIWRVLSVDGHLTEGDFTFRVGP